MSSPSCGTTDRAGVRPQGRSPDTLVAVHRRDERAARASACCWRVIAFALATAALAIRAAESPPTPTVTILIGENVFELEVAADPARRERGLMERYELPPDRGMLFVFPDEAPRRFWMKHTRIDLDIVYLDSAGQVVATATMRTEVPQGDRESETHYEDRLPYYPSTGPARFAIEFRSGTLALLRLAPGDRLNLDTARLAALAQ
jgi:uncharacterized membrane protein (UPF0127 family)